MKTYYDRRADEYDRTSHDPIDPAAMAPLLAVLSELPPRRTLDIACGTGWLARSLCGPLVGRGPEQEPERLLLIAEAKRAAPEFVIVEQQRPEGHPGEAWERRPLENGEVYEVYKRYRTARELAAQIDGEVLLDSPGFVAVRWTRPA